MGECVDGVTKAEAQVLWVCLGESLAIGTVHKCRHAMQPGSFFAALISAMFKADDQNRAKLALGFPEHVAAVEKWRHEKGFADRHIREAEGG